MLRIYEMCNSLIRIVFCLRACPRSILRCRYDEFDSPPVHYRRRSSRLPRKIRAWRDRRLEGTDEGALPRPKRPTGDLVVVLPNIRDSDTLSPTVLAHLARVLELTGFDEST